MKKFIEDLKNQLSFANPVIGRNKSFNQGVEHGLEVAVKLIDSAYNSHVNEKQKIYGPQWERFQLTKLGYEKMISELSQESKNWKTLYHQERRNVYQLEKAIEVLHVEQRELETDFKYLKLHSEANEKFINDSFVIHDRHCNEISFQKRLIAQHIKNNDKLIAEVDHLHMICSRTVGNYNSEHVSSLNLVNDMQAKTIEEQNQTIKALRIERNTFIAFGIAFFIIILTLTVFK